MLRTVAISLALLLYPGLALPGPIGTAPFAFMPIQVDLVTGQAPLTIVISGWAANACPNSLAYVVRIETGDGAFYVDQGLEEWQAYDVWFPFSVSHTYAEPGTYTLKAYIDEWGGERRSEVSVWTVTVLGISTPVEESTWGKVKALYR